MNDRSAEKFYILQAVFGVVVVQSLLTTTDYGTDSFFYRVAVKEKGYHAQAESYDFGMAIDDLFRRIEKSGRLKDVFVA